MTKKENDAKRDVRMLKTPPTKHAPLLVLPKGAKPTTKWLAGIEFVPDAWLRFEKFIRDIAKAGPQHKATKAPVGKRSKARNVKPKMPNDVA